MPFKFFLSLAHPCCRTTQNPHTPVTPPPPTRRSTSQVQNWGWCMFCLCLGSNNSHATPPPPYCLWGKGLLWRCCVVGGPLCFSILLDCSLFLYSFTLLLGACELSTPSLQNERPQILVFTACSEGPLLRACLRGQTKATFADFCRFSPFVPGDKSFGTVCNGAGPI